MKLESKLGLSTGFLVAAMFLSAYTAHTRMAEATRLSDADFESDPELDHKIGLDSFDHVRGHLG